MNMPPFIMTDEMKLVAADVNTELADWLVTMNFAAVNFEFGSIIELNQRLLAKDKTDENRVLKFPLLYMQTPFKLQHDKWGKFATTQGLDFFIIHETNKTWTSDERVENVFKPVIYPIYAAFIKVLNKSGARVQTFQNPVHGQYDFYYWGEAQQQVLNDVVDCMKLEDLRLQVNNNSNCPTDYEIN